MKILNDTDTPQSDSCLFLYNELAGYTVACLKHLASLTNVHIHVVKSPVNPAAPFQFDLYHDNITYYDRDLFDTITLHDLINKISPNVIFCSGWKDKSYLSVCMEQRYRIPVVLCIDNPWRNTLKQNIAAVAGPFYLKQYFTHCWVCGEDQLVYARKLGFDEPFLKSGLYSCDHELFSSYYNATIEEKSSSYPRRFIFVGRYTKLKGVKELWKAFTELAAEGKNDWELWCLGKGEYESAFPDAEGIRNFGFVQPSEMSEYIRQTGVFILPSHYEHWGVVVHEFAAAGFPLLCSDTTGAAKLFLKEGVNGFFHCPKNVSSLKKGMRKFISLTDEELLEMGLQSHRISSEITPETWSDSVLAYMK